MLEGQRAVFPDDLGRQSEGSCKGLELVVQIERAIGGHLPLSPCRRKGNNENVPATTRGGELAHRSCQRRGDREMRIRCAGDVRIELDHRIVRWHESDAEHRLKAGVRRDILRTIRRLVLTQESTEELSDTCVQVRRRDECESDVGSPE